MRGRICVVRVDWGLLGEEVGEGVMVAEVLEALGGVREDGSVGAVLRAGPRVRLMVMRKEVCFRREDARGFLSGLEELEVRDETEMTCGWRLMLVCWRRVWGVEWMVEMRFWMVWREDREVV